MKTRAKSFALSSIVLAVSLSVASADTIELQDGRKLSGTVSRQGNQATIKTDDGQTITAPWADIVRVSLSGPADSPAASGGVTPDAAKSEWTRIAAQIKTTPDLPKIIDLHQQFLAKYPDSPMFQQVKESLAVYQQLADAHAVKFHGKWMPPDQIDVLQKQWTEAAAAAVAAYKAGQFKEALDSAKAVLAKDDQNPDALMLAGLAAYRTKAYGVAHKYFLSLAESDPANSAALNNLAVASYQQKYASESLVHYTRALKLTPVNPVLLDNIIEAISAYKNSGADMKADNFRALTIAFTPVEAALEADMAQRGLYRFGSTWATKDQLSTAAANAKVIRAQMDPLDAKYKGNEDAIAALEAKLKQANADEDAAADLVYSAVKPGQIMPKKIPSDAELAALDARIDGAEEGWMLADQHRVTLLVQAKDLLTHQHKFLAEAQKLKNRLADAENPMTGEQLLVGPAGQHGLKPFAGDYAPRALPASASVPPKPQAVSTVSKQDTENADGSNAHGAVIVGYMRPINIGVIQKVGPLLVEVPIFIEIPQEDPGTIFLQNLGYGGPHKIGSAELRGEVPPQEYNKMREQGWPVRSHWISVTVEHGPDGSISVRPAAETGGAGIYSIQRNNPLWPDFTAEDAASTK